MRGAHSRRGRRSLGDLLPGWPLAPVLALLAAMLLVTGIGPAVWRSVKPDLHHPEPTPVAAISPTVPPPAAAQAATASQVIAKGPPSVQLVVIPAVRDFAFKVDGRLATTDARGMLRVDDVSGSVAVEAVGYNATPSVQLVQGRRWSDGSTHMRRTLTVRGPTRLALAVDISHRVTLTVDRPDGTSRSGVCVRVRSTAGVASLESTRTTWLLAARGVVRDSSIVPEQLVYSVESARSGRARLEVRRDRLDPIPEALWVVHLT